jgi:hypothetical protein
MTASFFISLSFFPCSDVIKASNFVVVDSRSGKEAVLIISSGLKKTKAVILFCLMCDVVRC